jgi:hypothetical protein
MVHLKRSILESSVKHQCHSTLIQGLSCYIGKPLHMKVSENYTARAQGKKKQMTLYD